MASKNKLFLNETRKRFKEIFSNAKDVVNSVVEENIAQKSKGIKSKKKLNEIRTQESKNVIDLTIKNAIAFDFEDAKDISSFTKWASGDNVNMKNQQKAPKKLTPIIPESGGNNKSQVFVNKDRGEKMNLNNSKAPKKLTPDTGVNTTDSKGHGGSFAYKAAALGIGGSMVFSMAGNKGQQSNQQLYGQY